MHDQVILNRYAQVQLLCHCKQKLWLQHAYIIRLPLQCQEQPDLAARDIRYVLEVLDPTRGWYAAVTTDTVDKYIQVQIQDSECLSLWFWPF